MISEIRRHTWLVGLLALAALLAVACGQAAAPTSAPPPAAIQATATPIPDATPTPAPTATPLPSGINSARDEITLVIPEEPIALSAFLSIGASLNAAITRSNLQDPLTWQSGDDLRIVPTSATVGWEKVDADTWRFELRQGVKFHNGEEWNAQASLPSFASLGNPASEAGSVNYTGSFTAEVVDDFVVDINCDIACPIFPNTAFFVDFEAPAWLASTTEAEQAIQSIGFGPYKHVEWSPGVSITQEAYEDYVPVGDHFEFQKPFIQNATWVWRGEPTVIAAMIETGEADIGWDIGVDSVGSLPANMVKAGSSAETYSLTTNTVWHPELKKKKVREAMVHAINCQEMIEFLYSGYTTCRGSIIWPGIIGATERNTAPYPFDPERAKQLLKEADYNPENKITITSRGTRIAKQIEVSEAIQGYLTEVGMNVDFQVVEPSIRRDMTRCGIGKATQEILEASGRNPEVDKPTNADFQAALDKGSADCPTGDLIGNQPSNETLDFGRQLRFYMSCSSSRSLICDPSPGGIQDQIAEALAASGDERQQRLEVLADRFHDDVLFISLFDLPVVYAVDAKLNWEPRLDPNIRVSTMWFSP
ncbi:MAG: ABC transporter substrate-binding protein [Dehalococcoidia bacterium]